MPIVIEPSWVGRRVSVRRVVERRPDGRLLQSDVVGDLVAIDEQSAVIESRHGLVEVPVALITIAKLVPPSTAEELALERVAAAGLRALEREELDGWTLRADHGFTSRANSVLPLRQLRMPLDDALAAAHEWYARRDLPLRIHLPVEARRLLDAELGERREADDRLVDLRHVDRLVLEVVDQRVERDPPPLSPSPRRPPGSGRGRRGSRASRGSPRRRGSSGPASGRRRPRPAGA